MTTTQAQTLPTPVSPPTPPPREILQFGPRVNTLAGGTRRTVLLDRPWQKEMIIDVENCPFEIHRDDPAKTFCKHKSENGDEWRARKNEATPFSYHRLIIPSCCMPVGELWTLGGTKGINSALATAARVIELEASYVQDLFLFVHVGYMAGQRYGHLHWHLVRSEGRPTYTLEEMLENTDDPDLTVHEDGHIRVSAGGVRAGQLLITPKQGMLHLSHEREKELLAEILLRTVCLCNERFKSAQGLPPDFQVALVLKREGICKWGTYIPILNHLGGSEYLAAMTGTAYCLPWPHEVTAAHLHGER